MAISKMDQFEVAPAKVKDLNPLNELDISIDLLYKEDSLKLD